MALKLCTGDWCRRYRSWFVVLDPDGWDRSGSGYFRSLRQRITREEFIRRCMKSTLLPNREGWRRAVR